MEISAANVKVFSLSKEGVSFYLDKKSRLFWSKDGIKMLELHDLPWKYQLPFFLQFLHNNEFAERFKDMEILGAIDVFIKNQYFFSSNSELNLRLQNG